MRFISLSLDAYSRTGNTNGIAGGNAHQRCRKKYDTTKPVQCLFASPSPMSQLVNDNQKFLCCTSQVFDGVDSSHASELVARLRFRQRFGVWAKLCRRKRQELVWSIEQVTDMKVFNAPLSSLIQLCISQYANKNPVLLFISKTCRTLELHGTASDWVQVMWSNWGFYDWLMLHAPLH